MSERPGIILYFDKWEPISQLPDEDVASFLRALIKYGMYGEVPDFTGMNAVMWSMIRAEVDKDDVAYQKRCWKNAYSTHCREEKRKNPDREPVSLAEWMERFVYQPISSDDERYTNTNTTTTPDTTAVTNTTPDTDTTTERGAGETRPLNNLFAPETESDEDRHERLKNAALEKLESYRESGG